jgi:hypothetical protein
MTVLFKPSDSVRIHLSLDSGVNFRLYADSEGVIDANRKGRPEHRAEC